MPQPIPEPTQFGSPLSDGMFIGSAVYALALGIGAVVLGMRVRQRWVAFWGGGLAVASAAYLVALMLGFR